MDNIKNSQGKINQDREMAIGEKRRKNFLRMIILPLAGAVGFVLLVFLGRDYLTRKEFMTGMQQVQEMIANYQKIHGKLPDRATFERFPLENRNLDIKAISYNPLRVLDNMPGDMILANSGKAGLRILPEGQAAILFNGDVIWLEPAEMEQRLKERERYYNSNLIKTE